MISKELLSYCQHIEDWPRSWQIDAPDIETGQEILYSVFVPFFEHLLKMNFTKKTVRKHIGNIWLLGGEIIRRVNYDEKLREMNGFSLVEMHISQIGGPYSRHLDTASEINSYDSSCKKLYKFMNITMKKA